MNISTESKKALRGGEYLIKETLATDIFIPEEFNEEQKMIAQTCQDFIDNEVLPYIDRLDKMEPGLMSQVMKKSGELGLLAVSIPEEYGGFGQSFVTSMLASDIMGGGGSYSVAFSAHTGIGTLTILYYGNEQQKQKYLPLLGSGEWLGAYCLTEPGAGSDANSGTTKATLTSDALNYIINGQKMWITNGGFADVLTVFAKIDNDRALSAFIVERNFPGIKFNAEEKKMGIKGSSTVQIFFEDCIVPVENLLGKRGEGFRIALNILNLGRIKLGANVIGSSKRAINLSVNYANERKQFKSLISSFGAIQYKLAEQVIRAFANESAVYRASQNVEDAILTFIAEGMEKGQANVEAQRKYAIEAALLKVYGSEMLDYVVDEGVQIHGGMGFSAETQIETLYRDSRINRIFEGTNEINRSVIAGTMLGKATKKELDILAEAEKVMAEITELKDKPKFSQEYYQLQKEYIANFKKATLLVMKTAIDAVGNRISTEQEIQFNIADILMQLYVAESLALRVEKMENLKSQQEMSIYKDILDVLMYESSLIIFKAAVDAVYSYSPENDIDKLINALIYFTRTQPVNAKEARRRIAAKLIEENRYKF